MLDVTHVRPLANRSLELTFEDGFQGIVEMDRMLKSYTGVFVPLLEDAYFQQVQVNTELGTIVWPNGADLCPDVLHAHATGLPINSIHQQ